ncbi:MAG: hypothetical protein JWN14_4741 [Chthonomonadales bacterium]|nr:hypothetical protein [Chthonomonadales bacterium]
MRTRTSTSLLTLSLALTALQAGAMPPRFHFTKIADDQGAPYSNLGYPAINNGR